MGTDQPEQIICPKCGFEQSKDRSVCLSCGVIFAKFIDREAEKEALGKRYQQLSDEEIVRLAESDAKKLDPDATDALIEEILKRGLPKELIAALVASSKGLSKPKSKSAGVKPITKKQKARANTIILVLACMGIFLLIGIIYQRLPNVWPQGSCLEVETDANNIVAAMSDYLSDPKHPGKILAKMDIEKLVDVGNAWKLTRCGDKYYIHVIDRTGKCPSDHQKQQPNWHSNIYTLKFDYSK